LKALLKKEMNVAIDPVDGSLRKRNRTPLDSEEPPDKKEYNLALVGRGAEKSSDGADSANSISPRHAHLAYS